MHVKKENDMTYAKGFRLAMVRAAAVFLLLLPAAPARSSDPGKAVFEQKCAACHAMQPGAKLTVKERLKVKGTPLWFAGSKFGKDWLAAWLTRPAPLLGVVWNTVEKGAYEHPAIAPDEAEQVTEYLMTAVDDTVEAGKAALLPAKRSDRRKFLVAARRLFEQHQGCYACHRYLNKRNVELGGFSAPSLVNARDRLQPDWVYSFIQNPRKYDPNSRCPIPGEKATNQFTDEDKAMLAGYVVSMGEK